jgi:hypothetical protein
VKGPSNERREVIVVGAVEVRRSARAEIARRAPLSRLERATKGKLEAFVTEVVGRGSEVRIDGWTVYGGLPTLGYRHRPINISRSDGEQRPRSHMQEGCR